MAIFKIVREKRNKIKYYFLGILVFKKKIKKLNIKKIHAKYKKLEEIIKKKFISNEKIKVSFFVGMSSMFPARLLFENMANNKNFEVSLIIIPDLRFGIEKAKEIQKQTISELECYKDLTTIVPINEEDDMLNLKNIADIVFIPFIYNTSHPKYDLDNIIRANILPALINYGFFRSVFDRKQIEKDEFSYLWKIFVETELNLTEYNKYQKIKGKNVYLLGYSKMDSLIHYKKETTKKTILIAPHHTIEGGVNEALSLSNFERYSDFFLSLPDKYKEIDFIFRPHPVLFIILEKPEKWGKEKVSKYIKTLKSKDNVIFSEGGGYFQEFVNSDGIINDCGSYLPEYFYTLKPQCYMLKEPSNITEKFIELGQKCLENCYISYEKEDIIKFIESVIIEGKDEKKVQRENFAINTIMYNYPNASKKIIEHLEAVLGEKNEKSYHLWNI